MATEDEIRALAAELRGALAELQEISDGLRAESETILTAVHAERAQLRQAREQALTAYAEEAREGVAGRAREVLQRRIDDGETTWRTVMTGDDQHWSAVAVRDEIVSDARAEVDRIELTDPETTRRYREHAVLRAGRRTGEWTT